MEGVVLEAKFSESFARIMSSDNPAELSNSELDRTENIDELKLMINGIKIHAAEANSLIGQRVFTEKDIGRVQLQIAPNR